MRPIAGNIVRSPGGGYVLIDLELADWKDRNPAMPLSFRPACWDDGTLDVQGRYTTASDVQLIGKLMGDPRLEGVRLSAVGEDLRQRMLDKSISAAEALQHPWLA